MNIAKVLLYEILGQTKLINRTQSWSVAAWSLGSVLWDGVQIALFGVMDMFRILIVVVVTLVFTFVKTFNMDAFYCI